MKGKIKLTTGITLVNKKYKKKEFYHYIKEPDNVVLIPVNRKKFIVVHDLYRADYAIDNYRKKWNKTPGINLLKTKFKKIYDLKIDGNVINSIYKGEN